MENGCQTRLSPTLRHKAFFAYEWLCSAPVGARGARRARMLTGRVPRATDNPSTAPWVVWYGARAVLPGVPPLLLPLGTMDHKMWRWQGAMWVNGW
jgi:hypothetical protein